MSVDGRLVFANTGVARLMAFDVAALVSLQHIVNIPVARMFHIPLRVHPGARADQRRLGDALEILCLRNGKHEQFRHLSFGLGRMPDPESQHYLVEQQGHVGVADVGVLENQHRDSLQMSGHRAQTEGSAVVLHVQYVVVTVNQSITFAGCSKM